MEKPIYFDYLATTPADPRVVEKMVHCLSMEGNFGNPASRSHFYGWKAEEAVETARRQVADLITRRSPGNRLDVRSDRIGQSGDQGCGALLPEKGQAHRYLKNRAQGGAGYLPPAGAGRV